MKDEFSICNISFKFNITPISNLNRLSINKVDKIVDFNKGVVIKLFKYGKNIKLCDINGEKINIDIIDYLKSDYEFMSQVLKCINLISNNYSPPILDVSDITGEVKINKNSILGSNIVVKWKTPAKTEEKYKDYILITIF